MEAARVACNKYMLKNAGKVGVGVGMENGKTRFTDV
jgi:ribosomal protein L16/L10AE